MIKMRIKRYLLFLVLTSFMFMGVSFADTTKSYFIKADILQNGDMEVTELKILDGAYNGILTELNYSSSKTPAFTKDLSSFEGSDIYNASSIEIEEVYAVSYDDYSDFNIINKKGTSFSKTDYASKGQYGLYTMAEINGGVNLKIYQPSSYRQASVVKYLLKDVVVLHNDVAEIAWDFIGSTYQDDIDSIQIEINLPGNSEELRVFSHGPLTGTNEIISRSKLGFKDEDFKHGNAIDIRVVFDKELVTSAKKHSEMDGLANILEVEKNRAEKANDQRKAAKRDVFITNFAGYVYTVSVIFIVIFVYFKYDKEYQTSYYMKYNREFIDDYNVEVIDYLMKKSITPNAMSASIMNLVYKKLVKVDKVKGSKDAYIFTLLKMSTNPTEQALMDFLFKTVGKDDKFTDADLQHYAESTKTYNKYISCYTSWKNKVMKDAETQNFWESAVGGKVLFILIILLGATITTSLFYNTYGTLPFMAILNIVLCLIAFIYIIVLKKRTKNGVLHHAKWKAFKNFLDDFGNFEIKDLPEIALWERYLVYATIFGLADKVSKVMNVKIKEYGTDGQTGGYTFTDFLFYSRINSSINRTVSHAYQAAIQTSARVASSAMSSSGGFGGGSSFGGGGFGGGGSGGGRF